MKSLLLSEAEVKQLITMPEVIDAVDKTFADLALENTLNPTKVNLNLGDSQPTKLNYKASMNAMPAYIAWQDLAGLKWAGGFGGGRREIKMPFINALIMLCEPNYGNFLSVMDGTWITNMRTGAQTAAILRHLFKGKKNATFGLYGAGIQGRTQTLALSCEFHVDQLVVYDPIRAAAEKFKEEMQSVVQGEIILTDDPRDVAQTDAFVSVTNANDGFIKGEWLKKGSLYFALGSYQECDEACILGADTIIVDHVGQCLHRGNLKNLVEAGKLSEKDIDCTVGELAAGLRTIENLEEKKTLVVPIGMGCLDIAVAGIVYKKAIAKGIGETFMFDRAE